MSVTAREQKAHLLAKDHAISVSTLLAVDPKEWVEWGIPEKDIEYADRSLEFCDRHNVKLLTGNDLPLALQSATISCLFQWGRELSDLPALSIVGSRRISSDSQEWMHTHLNAALNETVVQTCSGGAMGVDELAHMLSIRNFRPTVVFMPHGFGYQSHWSKWEKLAQDFPITLLSQFQPNCPISRHHFHMRNELIARYSPSTLVVQAGLKSGSIMTANLAADLGRRVGIVPSHPNHQLFRGNLKLAQEGAEFILTKSDIKNLMRCY